MKIGIIGGAGKAGSAVYREAIRRGDLPTAIVRDLGRAEGVLGEDAVYLVKDAFDLTASDLASYDVVVDALGVPPSQARKHVELAQHLVDLATGQPGPRLFFVLGAASLLVDGKPLLDILYEEPGTATWIATPEQQLRELEFLRTADVDWVGISPSESLIPGRVHTPLLGRDKLLTGSHGQSRVTYATLAVAILDEVHAQRVRRARFTVCDEDA